MHNLAIIPARGGSKRIPHKNFKDFFGKPVIAYSIEAALKSQLFDEVMVSTEDEEIAKIAEKYGAKVPFPRSKENADDFATTFDMIKEVINRYSTLNQHFENFCCIYPTPFISTERLNLAYMFLLAKKYDSVTPIVAFSSPIKRALRIANNNMEMIFPEYMHTRSQDLETMYHDAGKFYWANTKRVLENRTIWTNNAGSIIIPEAEVHDINSETDWLLAIIKYKLIHEND